MILRDALFRGSNRYSQFQQSLHLASNVLADRLDRFVADALFDVDSSAAYQVTEKARALVPVLLALTAWGDIWAAPHGPPSSTGTPLGSKCI